MRRRMLHRVAAAAATAIGLMTAVHAANPPETLNYQGVLRDAADKPREGSFDMVFTFFGGPGAADEILIDRHLAANSQAVDVAGGLFSVRLGSGEVLDGAGPGTYQALSEVFRDYQAVWLEVTVDGETLSPRIRINSAPYALNASHLAGRAAGEFLDTSGASQTKLGKLVLDNSAGSFGVDAQGATAGGSFNDADGSGYARVGVGDYGIRGFGNTAGGYFADSLGSGYAELGYDDYGVRGFGNITGGYFKDLDSTGYAFVGQGNRGIAAYGDVSGGFFENVTNGSSAELGTDLGYGVFSFGSVAGGRFKDLSSSGTALVGYGDWGIQASGSDGGGYFYDANSSGLAYVGYGHYGIYSQGANAGGYFKDDDGQASATVAGGGIGVKANGTIEGAYFSNALSDTAVQLATSQYSIEAFDRALFTKSGDTVTLLDSGGPIHASGSSHGGYFERWNVGTWVYTADGTASTRGNGAKNFIQNHPYDPEKVILYAALEGDEVGTYTRGSAKLTGGVARVALGPTFAWVTNPDIGLTAQLTARSAGARLYVESVTTSELVVRAEAGSDPEAAFDYVVQGLRIGFEQSPVIQPKEREAYIPSMAGPRELFAAQPELRSYTALDRFVAMRDSSAPSLRAPTDFSAADALREAIHEFDPAVDVIERPERPDDLDRRSGIAQEQLGGERPAGRPGAPDGRGDDSSARLHTSALAAVVTQREDSAAGQPELPQGAVLMTVVGAVEEGDLLALDTDHPGALRRADSALDAGVVGVAASTGEGSDNGAREMPVVVSGIAELKVDAGYGAIRPGDLLASSPTPGHAMTTLEIVPGTVIAKALVPLDTGTGTIRVLVMPR